MRLRFTLVLAAALFAASCGVDRDVEGASSEVPSTQSPTDDTAEGEPSDDGNVPTTTAPAPVTTAPDDEVAVTMVFADGSEGEVLHGELNAVASPTRDNEEFVNLVYQGQVPPGFEAVLLSQTVWNRVLEHELANADGSISEANRDEAKSLLLQQLAPLLANSPDPASDSERLYGEVPYLPFIADLQANQIALATLLASAAPADAGSPCVSHILVDTEDEALEAIGELAGGADFAAVASARSTDTGSAAMGGELGCAPSDAYVPEFAEAVDNAVVGEIVGPVETQFGFHVLVVDRLEVNGDVLAQERLEAGLAGATINVDERIGSWDEELQRIVPPTS